METPAKRTYYGYLLLSAIIVGLVYYAYTGKQENQRLQLLNIINQAENRVLKTEIHALEQNAKPSYEDGYKDALIKAGRPTAPGAYQDGYEAAMKIVGEGGYAEGYHAAIKQFNYQPNKNVVFLVDEPKKEVVPTKKNDK